MGTPRKALWNRFSKRQMGVEKKLKKVGSKKLKRDSLKWKQETRYSNDGKNLSK